MDRPGRRDRHQRHPGRPVRASTGQAPTTSGATSSTGSSWPPGCRSSSPCWPRPSRSSSGSSSAPRRSCSAAGSGRTVTASVNLAVAFPGLLLALFFAVIFGVGAKGAVLAIGLAGAPTFARLTQTLVAGVAARDYVAAARIVGVGRVRILLRHVLPNISRAAGRQRHDRRRGSAAGLRRALLPRAGCPGAALRLGPPPLRRHRRDLRQPRGRPRAGDRRPRRRSGVQPLRGVRRQGPRHRQSSGASARSPRRPPRPRRRRRQRPPTRRTTRPTWCSTSATCHVTFPGPLGPIRPVRGVSFSVRRGEAVGVVGESGSGKSLTALAVSRLVSGSRPRGRHPARAARQRPAGPERTGAAPTARHLPRDGLPGPDDLVQPDPPHRRPARRGRRVTTTASTARPPWPEPSTGCRPCGSPIPSGAPTSTPTSSPEACASGR